MPELTWQKSSYCAQGNSCVHVAATPDAIHITESSDPTGSILTTTPTAFAALLSTLKKEPGPAPSIEVTVDETGDGNGDAPVHLREPGTPDTVVTTTRHKWDAFVLGVQAGEFDHFVMAGFDSSHGLQRILEADRLGDLPENRTVFLAAGHGRRG